MIMTITSIILFTTLTSVITMTLQRTHLLMALLSLEMIILSLCLYFPSSSLMNMTLDMTSMLGVLTFGACEAGVGLACLVSLMRNKGNDMIKSINSSKC